MTRAREIADLGGLITADSSGSYFTGKLGIGTTSPVQVLHLGGASNKAIQITSSTSNAGYFGVYENAVGFSVNRDCSNGTFADAGKTESTIVLQAQNADSWIAFRTTPTNNAEAPERMRIDKDGNVGIGTSSPAAKLDITGNGTDIAFTFENTVPNNPLHSNYYGGFSGIGMDQTTAGVRIAGNSGATATCLDIGYYTSGVVSHANWNSSVMVKNDSKVGIGTTTPGENLEVNHASAPKIRFGRAASYYWNIGHTNSDFQFQSQSGGTVLHLNYDGNVGIGTTSPSQALDVVGNIEVSGGIYLGGTGAANLLDDYEEGTWTPNIQRSGGTIPATFSHGGGSYVKIGNMVHVKAYIYNMSNGSSDGTNYWVIYNMPFAANVETYSGMALAYNSSPADNCYVGDAGGNAILCVGSSPYTGAISGDFMLNINYRVN